MAADEAVDSGERSTLLPSELLAFQQRSDARGLLRLFGHLAAIAVSGTLYGVALTRSDSLLLHAALATLLGFTLVTMFAAMHESVHRTAFKTQWLNDGVGWFAGLLSFYNSTFYRPYHGWHHRYTQIPGQDPELEDRKPTNLLTYLIEISGVTWWLGKLRTHFRIALGKTDPYRFLTERTRPPVVRSVRLQLGVYALASVLSVLLGYPYFAVYWLIPMVLGQPLLRIILLAEHTGCSETDNALTNTRTTYTLPFVRFLMWEMPYHAEHHRYPALPFHSLAQVHQRIGPALEHVARAGYSGFHGELLKSLTKHPASERLA